MTKLQSLTRRRAWLLLRLESAELSLLTLRKELIKVEFDVSKKVYADPTESEIYSLLNMYSLKYAAHDLAILNTKLRFTWKFKPREVNKYIKIYGDYKS